MNLAQKLKEERERYVNKLTEKTIGYYTTDLLNSEGKLIACQMQDDLLKTGNHEIQVANPSMMTGEGCLEEFKTVDLADWSDKVVKFWKNHGFKCKQILRGNGEDTYIRTIVISLP